MVNCIHCNVELIEGDNWYASNKKYGIKVCKNCAKTRAKEKRETDPEFMDRQRVSNRKYAYRKYHAMSEEEKRA